MNRKFGSIEEWLEALGALAAGTKDVLTVGVEEYAILIRRAQRNTIFLLIAGISAVLLGEFIETSALNIFAFLCFVVSFLIWVALASPIILAANALSEIEWKPIKKTISWMSSLILIISVLLVYIAVLPPGLDGLTLLGIITIGLAGFSAIGLKLSRQVLGIQLVAMSMFMALGYFMPKTVESFSFKISDIDRGVAMRSANAARELNMTAKALTGSGDENAALFARGDGALWWCRDDPIEPSGYRCYDREGRDPYTNVELEPISREIVANALSNITRHHQQEAALENERKMVVAEQNRLKSEQIAQAKKIEAEREHKVRLANLKKQLDAYREAHLITYASKQNLVMNIQKGFDFDSILEQSVAKQLALAANPFLKKSAIKSGVFSKLLDIDQGEVQKLGLDSVADKVIVGRLTESFSPIPAVKGSGSINLKLELTEFRTDDLQVVSKRTAVSAAKGQNREIARNLALQKLLSDLD
ncbi:MAG: hypothetical protein HKN50_10885 [Gammaproteobacteria bacterium]|nr:hypothetical protein [Gammaproteobacteria bacterium]